MTDINQLGTNTLRRLVAELREENARLEAEFQRRDDAMCVRLPAKTGCDCGCCSPCFTTAREALEFLSGRFKYAGVSDGVALSYARDIDQILAADVKAAAEMPT